MVSIDSVGANAGEIVFFVTGSSARMTETTREDLLTLQLSL